MLTTGKGTSLLTNTTRLNVTKTIFLALIFLIAIFLVRTFWPLALHVNLMQKKIADKSKYEIISMLYTAFSAFVVCSSYMQV